MTASIFNVRRVADFGEAFTTYTASQWNDETKVIYLLGRRPQVYFDKFNDPSNELHGVL